MSREAYQPQQITSTPPNGIGVSGAGGANTTQAGFTGFNLSGSGATAAFEDTSRPVQYLCGDCDTKVTIKKGDPIRCKECGYRVLYKERTNRMIQFEAR